MKACLPKGARAVEIGCGTGDFVRLLRADGWFVASGFDAPYAGDDPAVEARFLTSADRVDADLVILRHVLEHMQRPHEFLSLLRTIFRDADIYIEVPEFSSTERENTFLDVTYEHVNYFTPQSLVALFHRVRAQGLLFGDQCQYAVALLRALCGEAYVADYDAEDWDDVALDPLFVGLRRAVDSLREADAYRGLAVWGAATKGVLFCHHVMRDAPDVGRRIACAVDVNPRTQGGMPPSTRLPILSPADFAAQATGDEIAADLARRGLSGASLRAV